MGYSVFWECLLLKFDQFKLLLQEYRQILMLIEVPLLAPQSFPCSVKYHDFYINVRALENE